MNKYMIDTHVHTSETSHCGKIAATDIIKLYKSKNYSGIIITDHYAKSFFDRLEAKSWNEKIDRFLKGFDIAQKEGKRLGINIFLGMEISFVSEKGDFLIYGIDKNFLYNNKNLYEMGLNKFKQLIKGKDILIYQAHPFRSSSAPGDPLCLDGVEVYNGNQRHNSNNDFALEFASSHNLKMISGSDFHRKEDLGKGGIILPDNPQKISTIIKMLSHEKNVELITN